MFVSGDKVLRTPCHSTFNIAIIRFIIFNNVQSIGWFDYDTLFRE